MNHEFFNENVESSVPDVNATDYDWRRPFHGGFHGGPFFGAAPFIGGLAGGLLASSLLYPYPYPYYPPYPVYPPYYVGY